MKMTTEEPFIKALQMHGKEQMNDGVTTFTDVVR